MFGGGGGIQQASPRGFSTNRCHKTPSYLISELYLAHVYIPLLPNVNMYPYRVSIFLM